MKKMKLKLWLKPKDWLKRPKSKQRPKGEQQRLSAESVNESSRSNRR